MKTCIVYGPTATGKTALAISLAKKHHGEIISADSRQVYCGLDIGSGKVGLTDKVEKCKGYWKINGVKIHGFDLCAPGENFTAADFINSTVASLKKITSAGHVPIIVGGTGFYIKLLLDGLGSYGIPADQKLREELNKLTKGQLARRLKKIDPEKLEAMNISDRSNPRRLIRAIEIALSGKTKEGLKPIVTNAQLIGLTASNPYIYQKSDAWLQSRIDHGLVEEVKSLLENNVDPQWLEKLGLEYRWITLFVTGKLPIEAATAGLRGDTHDFIRRQKNWFKQFTGIKIYDIENGDYTKLIGKDLLV